MCADLRALSTAHPPLALASVGPLTHWQSANVPLTLGPSVAGLSNAVRACAPGDRGASFVARRSAPSENAAQTTIVTASTCDPASHERAGA